MKIHASRVTDLAVAGGIALGSILSVGIRASAQPAELVSRTALRVCADPANMPFSNEAGQGFENKIAVLLAADFGLPLEYTWFPQAVGFIRNTLGAKRCDVVIGYVAGSEPLQNTNPYYKSAWALIYRKGIGLDGVEMLDDPRLRDRRLGIVAGAPPATILAMNGLMGHAKPYPLMVDRRYESPAEEMIRDIVSGDIDGGILWGPIGGYYATKSGAPLTVIPLVHETNGPPMVYRVTFGLRQGEIEWKHRLNDFLAAKETKIRTILMQYDVPLLDEQDRPITVP